MPCHHQLICLHLPLMPSWSCTSTMRCRRKIHCGSGEKFPQIIAEPHWHPSFSWKSSKNNIQKLTAWPWRRIQWHTKEKVICKSLRVIGIKQSKHHCKIDGRVRQNGGILCNYRFVWSLNTPSLRVSDPNTARMPGGGTICSMLVASSATWWATSPTLDNHDSVHQLGKVGNVDIPNLTYGCL